MPRDAPQSNPEHSLLPGQARPAAFYHAWQDIGPANRIVPKKTLLELFQQSIAALVNLTPNDRTSPLIRNHATPHGPPPFHASVTRPITCGVNCQAELQTSRTLVDRRLSPPTDRPTEGPSLAGRLPSMVMASSLGFDRCTTGPSSRLTRNFAQHTPVVRQSDCPAIFILLAVEPEGQRTRGMPPPPVLGRVTAKIREGCLLGSIRGPAGA